MGLIQPFVNAILFLWLLGLTAFVVKWKWGHGVDHLLGQDNRQLVEQVEDGQRLINAMSEDLLALSQRMIQDLDELRTTVSSMERRAATSSVASSGKQPLPSSTEVQTLPSSLERYRGVYQRAAQGQNVTEIAKELGMGKGEVELVLALGQQEVFERHKS